MTVVVNVNAEDQEYPSLVVSDSAMEAVRFRFNPRGLDDVTHIKALTSALITKCEALQKSKPEAARELAVAITNTQTASMWAVQGAGKEKPE